MPFGAWQLLGQASDISGRVGFLPLYMYPEFRTTSTVRVGLSTSTAARNGIVPSAQTYGIVIL
jgi:hypothetical protein